MNVSNSIKYTSNFIKNNYITSNTSQKEKNHQANVEVSKQDIFTSTRSNGEQVTYNLKLLRSQKSFNDADTVKLDMSDRDNISTMQNKQFININWETNEHKYGHLIGKEKIDEFISMTERLDPEQLDKMQYLAPSQDWMNLADKVVDEQLNSLVDLAFDISEFVFFEAYSSENVDSIIQELNTLDSNELNGAINTMLHLNEQAKNSDNNGSMPFSHNVTAEIDDRHEKQIRSKYKPLFEKLGNENLKVMWHSELIN
jgi:hypothetical protein